MLSPDSITSLKAKKFLGQAEPTCIAPNQINSPSRGVHSQGKLVFPRKIQSENSLQPPGKDDEGQGKW